MILENSVPSPSSTTEGPPQPPIMPCFIQRGAHGSSHGKPELSTLSGRPLIGSIRRLPGQINMHFLGLYFKWKPNSMVSRRQKVQYPDLPGAGSGPCRSMNSHSPLSIIQAMMPDQSKMPGLESAHRLCGGIRNLTDVRLTRPGAPQSLCIASVYLDRAPTWA